MKVCLVVPPAFLTSGIYPLNIECIASVLRRASHEVSFVDGELIASGEIAKRSNRLLRIISKIFIKQHIVTQQKIVEQFFDDMNCGLWDLIAEHIVSHNPDVIGFSCYTASMSSTKAIINRLRNEYNIRVPIVLGGIHPTSAPKETLAMLPGVDYAIIGEGEYTILELIKSLDQDGIGVHNIPGVAWRNGSEIVVNEPRMLIPDLSDLPILEFDFASEDYYQYVLLTSRGCPFGCKFCSSKTIWGRKVRYRHPEHVAREVVNLRRKVRIRRLRFGDDTFTVSRKHMEGVIKALERERVTDIKYAVGSRIDTLNQEKLKLLRRMGVFFISFGVETGSAKIANSIDKGISLEEVVPTVRMANDMGFNTITFFIINHPEEMLDDMRQTLGLIKELHKHCPLNQTVLSTAFPYPATDWWRYCENKGLLSNIDIYSESYKYNHQLEPAVNMTNESTHTMLKMKKKLDVVEKRHNMRLYGKKFMKSLLSDPSMITRKLNVILRK